MSDSVNSPVHLSCPGDSCRQLLSTHAAWVKAGLSWTLKAHIVCQRLVDCMVAYNWNLQWDEAARFKARANSTASHPDDDSSSSSSSSGGVESDAMVVQKEEKDPSVCFPKVSQIPQNHSKFPLKKQSIEARHRPLQLETIDVVTSGVVLATFTLTVEVAVNDVHVKISRTSGKLDVIVPESNSCPLGPLAGDALPRCVFGALD
ncbi:hypothetical protein FOL47_008413 [Perkinsus chesapeaki]|uniref:Uncharacterized protein n=1 Tax=Perkinsus chesapeaki TaxID=330153 RepID=A0A7J6LE85_PERCH|nr:hypothetical protein FOL47_008413 [Perkinsus chesapeaki]